MTSSRGRAHNCYELIISIITHGGSGRVYRNVPILFGWIVICLPLNWFMNWRMNRLNLKQAKFDPKLQVDRLLHVDLMNDIIQICVFDIL